MGSISFTSKHLVWDRVSFKFTVCKMFCGVGFLVQYQCTYIKTPSSVSFSSLTNVEHSYVL